VELLYVTVIGAFIGLALRYVFPGHDSYGLFLLPAVGASSTAVVWVALVWVGLKFDGGWIWVAAIGAAVGASTLVALLLVRGRAHGDERRLHHLSGGRA
jgi:O-antigen/teichoic acid export membrane protein